MKIDLNTYAINKPFIQKKNKESPGKIRDTLTMVSASTHCALICLVFYLAEDLGWTDELKELADGYIKFYGYTKIIGQLSDSPYLHLS